MTPPEAYLVKFEFKGEATMSEGASPLEGVEPTTSVLLRVQGVLSIVKPLPQFCSKGRESASLRSIHVRVGLRTVVGGGGEGLVVSFIFGGREGLGLDNT